MTMETPEQILDARGLACPMPIVKARQALNAMQPGDVLRILATDRGSVKDFQGWAQSAKNVELVAQETREEDGKPIYVHVIKRVS